MKEADDLAAALRASIALNEDAERAYAGVATALKADGWLSEAKLMQAAADDHGADLGEMQALLADLELRYGSTIRTRG